jgi:hypothetical protein
MLGCNLIGTVRGRAAAVGSRLLALAVVALLAAPAVEAAISRRQVALLDLAGLNADTSYSTFGLTHALDVAGVPWIVTTSVDDAMQYSMVVTSSYLAGNTFGTGALARASKDKLVAYVNGGGVLVTTNVYDAYLFPLFGISGHLVKKTRHAMSWQTATLDPTLSYFDDPNEQTISLGSPTRANVIATRGYTLSTGTALARFDDASVAVARNAWGAGRAYALGFSYTDLIVRNQLDRDFRAERTTYNGFEPTSDTIMLFLRRIYESSVPFAAWRFTAPYPARSVLMLTHDLHPSKKSFDGALEFAAYENGAGVSANYTVQTNYLADANGDSYTPRLPQLVALAATDPTIGTHTVGHFKDWADETHFPLGAPGNTKANYNPVTNGTTTTGGTVYGEIEVPKRLIETDAGVTVQTFRSGSLYWNDKQANVLDALGYRYDSSNSANDVLTNFPYLLKHDRAFDGATSSVYEIPMTLWDLGLTGANYEAHVTHWLGVIDRNAANFAPTVLLSHPHYDGGLAAEQSLVQQLAPGIATMDLDVFGDYWRARSGFRFRTTLQGNVLTITVLNATPLPSAPGFSLFVEDGAELSGVVVRRANGTPLTFQTASAGGTGLFVHGIGE